jgi:DNA-binding HxlR family transcriptional regulator
MLDKEQTMRAATRKTSNQKPRKSAKVPEGRDPWPVRHVFDRLGDAWSVLVVLHLGGGPQRFNALQRQIEGISPRLLTVTLRKLERDGLVGCHIRPTTPPHVEYALTKLGRSLAVPIKALNKWAANHQHAIEAAHAAYDDRQAV